MTVKNDSPGVGELARTKLIQAALDMFGQHGFDGVSIRQISDSAGMNVASISYHFGSKDGLYSAVADYISEQIATHSNAPVAAAESFINSASLDAGEALQHILNIVENTIEILIPDSDQTKRWARFVTQFQLGEHNQDHQLSKNPFHGLVTKLVSIVRHQPDNRLENAIIAQTIFGQILVFRVSRLSSKIALNISTFGAEEVAQIKRVVFSNIQKLLLPEGA
ncbi:TetR family transcriptional regulator [Arenicella xantha]|uniref:TetR family transcriptional regulator n=1 Tax=Arenicella xantha TaxID=644221 RepID=A0A395JIX0_9GAMM|nr:TetR family transcriptional regulator [Arenicella xantha]RBP50662.1 TetR family transcriptional regulator [Arenicella xantha]